MGMLMHHTWKKQQEQKKQIVAEPEVKEEEIPFTEPEEPAEEPAKKTTVRKPVSTANRRRKSAK